MEDYLSLKREGNSAIFDNRVMTIENIIISEMSQSQKDKYCNDYIYEVSKIIKSIESKR